MDSEGLLKKERIEYDLPAIEGGLREFQTGAGMGAGMRPALPPKKRRKFWTRGALVRLGLVAAVFIGTGWYMIGMPGKSFRGPLPALDGNGAKLAADLRRWVVRLAEEIGERNLDRYPKLQEAADFIEAELTASGLRVDRQAFTARKRICENLQAELLGSVRPEEIVVVGAHYDSVIGSPGANDNASGVAGLLALARAFAGRRSERTLRFVAFANEEPPYFQGPDMGSRVYAHGCHERAERIVAMLSLETIGYYSQEKGSQRYPFPLGLCYPSEGNFIGFVGNLASRGLVRQAVACFRRNAQFPSEGGALPGFIPGVGWSDHWSFWQEDYPAIMVTDTALFRYPHYHEDTDTPDRIDYESMARVVQGLERVIAELTRFR